MVVVETHGIVRHETEHDLEPSVSIEATLKTGGTWYDVASFEVDDVAVEPVV